MSCQPFFLEVLQQKKHKQMKSKNSKTVMRKYSQPTLRRVILDNEISLSMESAPPIGPDEGYLAPDKLRNDPYKHISV